LFAANLDPLMTLSPRLWHEIRQFYWERLLDDGPGLGLSPHPTVADPGSVEHYNRIVSRIEAAPQDAWLALGAEHFQMPQADFPSPIQVGLWPLSAADLISVVVPVFNEQHTIISVLRDLACVPAVAQIIVVNDASRDDTAIRLQELAGQLDAEFWQRRLPRGMLLLSHTTNQGKGAALQTGFRRGELPWIGIQDADTEYNPQDLMRLLTVARCRQASVVYGSRFRLSSSASSPIWHRAGNSLITGLANACFRLRLTDVETCYKLIDNQRLQAIVPTLKEGRFGIEIELTAKLARSPGVCFAECPIAYDHRTYAEGKKIGLRDAFRAVWCMGRYGWQD
jgi:hypothetical protein